MDCKCTMAQMVVGDGCDICNPTLALEHAREEITSIRQQLASMTKERDEIAAQARMLDRMVDERDEQLAASAAAIEAKDDAILGMFGPTRALHEDRWDRLSGVVNIKPDASILKAHDDALIERCADICDKGGTIGAALCAEAIRELKGTL